MATISVEHLTKDYGHGRGVFDVSLQIDKGECYGFLGPNGAGKTTTIRHLMGFSKHDEGKTSIIGLDSWKHSAELQNTVGYLPGEVTLPDNLTGTGFLKMMEHMRGIKNDAVLRQLLDRFQLDPNIGIKQMSLGVRRKLAVVTAFMHDPDILILDEPTSGLDPVMQEEFIRLVEEQSALGKTIFLSSHIFHEVDAVCDRIAIIRNGSIASEFNADEMKETQDRIYRIAFANVDSWEKFVGMPFNFTSKNREKLRARVQISPKDTDDLIAALCDYQVADFVEIPFTLEDYFMSFYGLDEEVTA